MQAPWICHITLFPVLESACLRFSLHGIVACCTGRLRINTSGSVLFAGTVHIQFLSGLEHKSNFLVMWQLVMCQNLELSKNSYCSVSIFCPPHCCKVIYDIHALDWIRGMTPIFWKIGLTLLFLLLPSPGRITLEKHKKQDTRDLLIDLVNVSSKY